VVQWALVVALLTGVAALAFAPQVFDGAAFPWDFTGKYTTAPAFVSASIDNGVIPRWAPGTASGVPILEDPGSGAYYPVWWITGLLSMDLTLNFFAKVQVVHIIAGGVGVVALMRARKVGWRWGVLAAMAFVLSGVFFGQAQHANFVRGFALFPWLLWSITAPRDEARWYRLLALPGLAYLAAASIYPGQLISLPVLMIAYLAAEWMPRRSQADRRTIAAFGAVAVACLLFLLAVYGGFIASQTEITRASPGTAAQRAVAAMGADDLLGLFLNPFAIGGGANKAWAIAIPMLIGLAGVTPQLIRRHSAVLVMGAVALLLASLPSWEPAGRVMVAAGPLFTSRFAAADYKIGVVLAIAFFGSLGWRNLLAQPRVFRWRAALAGLVIAGGLWAGSDIGGPGATRHEWLILAVVVASLGLVLLARRIGMLPLVVLVGLLSVGDGLRAADDQVAELPAGDMSAWNYRHPTDELAARDAAAAVLAAELGDPPATRPARNPPVNIPIRGQGTPRDALGYLALGYWAHGHGGFQTEAKYTALNDPSQTERFVQPWTAWIVSCERIDCDQISSLPDDSLWHPSDEVETVTYDTDRIDYRVDLEERVLVIENEVNYAGWRSGDDRVTPVQHDGAFRAWILEPGRYEYSTEFRTDTLGRAVLLVVGAALAWAIAAWLVTTRKRIAVESGASGAGSQDDMRVGDRQEVGSMYGGH